MELLRGLNMSVISAALLIVMVSVRSVKGQISTPCTSSMISSTFTPCANLITGSTNNGTTPSSSCCDSLRSLMSTSSDCACLLVSANVPLQLPLTSAFALALTQACNINNGQLAQCKASASPLPAPGPAALGGNGLTSPPPTDASPLSPQGSKVAKFESRRLAEASEPSMTPRIRPVVTPSSSSAISINPSYVSFFSHFVLLFIAVTMVVSTTL